MKRRHALLAVAIGLLVFWAVWIIPGGNSQTESAYYRGVYDTCVRSSERAGVVTSFDLIACHEFAERARLEGWYLQPLFTDD